jgi:seryl-tRNA synthetase
MANMLDIKFIRENKDLVKEGARKKHVDFNVDELIALDDVSRGNFSMSTEVNELNRMPPAKKLLKLNLLKNASG